MAAAAGISGVEADQHSLLAIYGITGGRSTWRYSNGWADAAENVDEWEGVSTDATGRVVSLVLPFNRWERRPSAGRTFAEVFRGAMARRQWMRWTPPRALTILNLSGNKLSGYIPPGLGMLPNLTELILNDNQLTGRIPTAFEELSSLQVLSIRRNRLDDSVWWIRRKLGWLPLKRLLLSDNRITGVWVLSQPDWSIWKELEELDLSGNRITGEIPDSVGDFGRLRALDFRGNLLTGLQRAWACVGIVSRTREGEEQILDTPGVERRDMYLFTMDGYTRDPSISLVGDRASERLVAESRQSEAYASGRAKEWIAWHLRQEATSDSSGNPSQRGPIQHRDEDVVTITVTVAYVQLIVAREPCLLFKARSFIGGDVESAGVVQGFPPTNDSDSTNNYDGNEYLGHPFPHELVVDFDVGGISHSGGVARNEVQVVPCTASSERQIKYERLVRRAETALFVLPWVLGMLFGSIATSYAASVLLTYNMRLQFAIWGITMAGWTSLFCWAMVRRQSGLYTEVLCLCGCTYAETYYFSLSVLMIVLYSLLDVGFGAWFIVVLYASPFIVYSLEALIPMILRFILWRAPFQPSPAVEMTWYEGGERVRSIDGLSSEPTR